ncbi:tat pathway signal sequence [Colletotrichum musicola]|uniref:Tat pathway signal sequence n=1 Tax=Colletotrichum musicola TaxID=2175873 RepID=A0A8H6NIA1_9PEZI|nr:tat pathway signal sequence [Colletotrichum musicola]
MASKNGSTAPGALPSSTGDNVKPPLADIDERVEAKEKAREAGVSLLLNIKAILAGDLAGRSLEGFDDWTASLEMLTEAPRSREIRAGLLGGTGLGKSSLLNALMATNIVPTSQSEACTAAICIYRWNSISENKKILRARITFKSWETVEAELDEMRQELEDLEEAQGLMGSFPDAGYDGRVADLNQQIIQVQNWSGLKRDEIKTWSPKQIISRSKTAFSENFRRGRGDRSENTYKDIMADNKNDFSELLKPYIDSSKAKAQDGKSFKYWPLVQLVEVFLKADILKHGIQLVDLPGTHDALTSRSQIAQSYEHYLDKHICVTPASRAVDNKAAADFIFSRNDSEALDMDDMLKGDSMCVAITKIDDIDCSSAETEFPTQEVRRVCEALAKLEGDDDYPTDEDSGDSKAMGLKRTGKSHGTFNSSKRQKLGDEVATEHDDLSGMDAEELRFRLKELCIRARNEEMKVAVDDRLLKARRSAKNAQSPGDSLPAMYPVSSRAFQDFKKRSRTLESHGFPTPESTGIPQLREWLRRVSLPYREEWADGDIHHIQVLLDAADGWMRDDVTDFPQLSETEKTRMQIGLKPIADELKEIINVRVRTRLRDNLSRMKPLRGSSLVNGKRGKYSRAGGPQIDKAFENLTKLVLGWRLKNPWGSIRDAEKHDYLHWSTYKACVRRHGGLFTRPARKGQEKSHIHWMADVQRAFWRGHSEFWKDEFSTRLPKLKSRVRTTVRRAFDHWVKEAFKDDSLPSAFQDRVRANMYKLEHLVEKYIADVRQRLEKFFLACRFKSQCLVHKFAEHMRPGFEVAMTHKGRGILKKQRAEVEGHAEKVGRDMFREVRDQLEDELAHDLREVSSDIHQLWFNKKTGCGARIEGILARIAKILCQGKAMKKLSEQINEDTKLQLNAEIGEWRVDWSSVAVRLPHAELTEELEEVEEAEPNIKMEEDAETGEVYEQFVTIRTEPVD